MNDDAELLKKVQWCFKKNLNKTIFSQLMLFLAQVLIVTVVVVFNNALSQIAGMFMVLPLAFAGAACVLLFQYGFLIILYKNYAGQYAVLGDLLSGLRDFKRMYPAAGLFILLEIAPIIIAVGVSLALHVMYPNLNLLNFNMLSLFALLFAALLVLMILPFAFVWFEMYTRPSIKTLTAFKASAQLLKGNKIRMLVFVIKAAGVFLLVVALIYGIDVASNITLLVRGATGVDTQSSIFFRALAFLSGGIAGRVLDFVYYVCSFAAVGKAGYALAALYCSLTINARDPALQSDAQSVPPVILLSGPDENTP
jgi:hypothetical protein